MLIGIGISITYYLMRIHVKYKCSSFQGIQWRNGSRWIKSEYEMLLYSEFNFNLRLTFISYTRVMRSWERTRHGLVGRERDIWRDRRTEIEREKESERERKRSMFDISNKLYNCDWNRSLNVSYIISLWNYIHLMPLSQWFRASI